MQGAKRGLLIRGGDILESLSQVDTVVFDKTGTLTLGEPSLTHMHSSHLGDDRLLALAAAVEGGSTHPLARAVVRAAKTTGLQVPDLVPGSTMQARSRHSRWANLCRC